MRTSPVASTAMAGAVVLAALAVLAGSAGAQAARDASVTSAAPQAGGVAEGRPAVALSVAIPLKRGGVLQRARELVMGGPTVEARLDAARVDEASASPTAAFLVLKVRDIVTLAEAQSAPPHTTANLTLDGGERLSLPASLRGRELRDSTKSGVVAIDEYAAALTVAQLNRIVRAAGLSGEVAGKRFTAAAPAPRELGAFAGGIARSAATTATTGHAAATPPSPPAAAAAGTSSPVASLADIIRWSASAGDYQEHSYTVALLPALDAAIKRVAPTWRPLRADEVQYGSRYDAARPAQTHTAIVADVDGDGRAEAVLVGVLADREGRRQDQGLGLVTVEHVVVLLGVRQTPHGFEVTELSRGPLTLASQNGPDVPPVTETILSLALLSPAGKSVGGGGTPWVRWQDGDCKDEGWQWTLKAGRWVRSPSDCSYGD